MAQLSEVVKLEVPIKFFKRISVNNVFGRLVEEFEEYLIKGYIEQKIIAYNATMGELTRPSNQVATEIEFFVLNYRVPTTAKRISDNLINKNLIIEEGDQVEYDGNRFQIYNIIDVDKHAYRTCELISPNYPVIMDSVDEDIQKFWYLYLQKLGITSFRDFPHWQLSHFYGLLGENFATYEIIYVSNRDDVSTLDNILDSNGGRIKYNFKFRRFIDVLIKVYSDSKLNDLDFKLRNQKVMYLLNDYTPEYFYNWGILEKNTKNLGARYVVINNKNKLQTSFKVRFGYTAELNILGDYINVVNLQSHFLGGD